VRHFIKVNGGDVCTCLMRRTCMYNFLRVPMQKPAERLMTSAPSRRNTCVGKISRALGERWVDNHEFLLSRCNHVRKVVVGQCSSPCAYALILLRQDGYPCISLRRLLTGHTYKGQGSGGANVRGEYEILAPIALAGSCDKFLLVRSARTTAYRVTSRALLTSPAPSGWTAQATIGQGPGRMAALCCWAAER